jgi:hypothetical protein
MLLGVMAVALVVGLTACGGGGSSTGGGEGEGGGASAALTAFMKARGMGDWATECSYAGAPALQPLEEMAKDNPQYKGKPCPVLLAALAKLQPAKVRENNLSGAIVVREEGAKTVAVYHGPEGKAYAMPMVKEGGDWKVASLLTEPAG